MATVRCSRFVGNRGEVTLYQNFGSINAINNWWGSSTFDPLNLFGVGGSGTITYDPWIIMSLYTGPSNLLPGIITTITADFTQNSSGEVIGNCLPDGTPIAFGALNGTVTPITATTLNGLATTLLSLNSTGSGCALDADQSDIIDFEQCITVL